MNYDQCKWSEHIVPLSMQQLTQCNVVECPECGAIRSVPLAVIRENHQAYPSHNVLMGTARSRPQWWKQERASKVWQLISE